MPPATSRSSRFARNASPQISFDLMDGAHAFALEVASSSLGKNRFGHKTILNSQCFFHCGAQIFLNLNRVSHQRNDSPPPQQRQCLNRAGGFGFTRQTFWATMRRMSKKSSKKFAS